MIRSSQELYEKINNIRDLLKKNGGELYAEKLYDAMYISTVVTEIFFTLQFELEQIRETDYFKDKMIGPLVQECLDAVNGALTAAGGWSKRRS
ncbi:MAG: hypothetical protein V4496_06755 [Pseudomonadota bacterium]